MWPFRRAPRIEDPERLNRFLETLESADWQNAAKGALAKTFSAINDLAYHEIMFYYRARKKQRRFSALTRISAVLLGTLGVLAPLLAGANPSVFGGLAPYGYALLAAAGSVLLINRLFGATGGHIRYVTAQLELERALTEFRLEWAEWSASNVQSSPSVEATAEAFEILRRFSNTAYQVIQEETNVWGNSVSEALQEYSSYIDSHGRRDQSKRRVESTSSTSVRRPISAGNDET